MLRKTGFKQKTYLESKKIKESKIKGKIGQSKAKKLTYKQKKKAKQKERWGIKLWSIKKADIEMSKYIRTKKDYTCEYCGYYATPPTQEIQCSHYIGRSEYATRYDENNLDCFCAKCHKFLEDRKQYEYREWKISKMGKEKHDLLALKKQSYKGVSEAIFETMKLINNQKL